MKSTKQIYVWLDDAIEVSTSFKSNLIAVLIER